MDNNNNQGLMHIGGVLAVVVIGMIVVKAVGQFLFNLSIAMDNFGKMMGSFIFLLWNTFEVVSLVAMILMATVGGVYFVVRYFRAVKEVTDNRTWLARQTEEAASDVDRRLSEMDTKIAERIDWIRNYVTFLDRKLEKALEKTEVAPPAVATVPSAQSPAPEAVVDSGNVSSMNPY